jgi:hypothetical protein
MTYEALGFDPVPGDPARGVSARLRDSDADPPAGRIDVNATGRRRDEVASQERRATP